MWRPGNSLARSLALAAAAIVPTTVWGAVTVVPVVWLSDGSSHRMITIGRAAFPPEWLLLT